MKNSFTLIAFTLLIFLANSFAKNNHKCPRNIRNHADRTFHKSHTSIESSSTVIPSNPNPTASPVNNAVVNTDANNVSTSSSTIQSAVPAATSSAATATSAAESSSAAVNTVTNNFTGSCSNPDVQVFEIDLGLTYNFNEAPSNLSQFTLSPLSNGESRLAFLSPDGHVKILPLDSNFKVSGSAVSIAAHDYSDLLADENGGVLLLTRPAEGDTANFCGNQNRLCNKVSENVICTNMYMIRYDGNTETWATKLSTSNSTWTPYDSNNIGKAIYFEWWNQRGGRLATDGKTYAAFYASSVVVPRDATCQDIHEGGQMRVLDFNGSWVKHQGFDWGVSHIGMQRLIYDTRSESYVKIAGTDNQNRITFAPNYITILPVNWLYADMSEFVPDTTNGYWLSSSIIQSGQNPNQKGYSKIVLLHFTTGAADKIITIVDIPNVNSRNPHLVLYGNDKMILSWEQSTKVGSLINVDLATRQMYIQVLSTTDGSALSAPIKVNISGNFDESMKKLADGSVAYVTRGSTSTTASVLHIRSC